MPEPGISNRDFDNPATDRKNPRRRPPARIKLPGEYAEFRLKDGRYLGDVLGDGFFGPETGAQGGRPITDSERQRIRDGNYPLAGMFRDNPQFRPRPETGAGIVNREREAPARAVEEIAPTDLAHPNVQTPPLPVGEASPPRATTVTKIAFELGEQGNPVAVNADGDTAESQAGAGNPADGKAGANADAQARKERNWAVWLRWAGFGGDTLPGWKKLPKLEDGRIGRDSLDDDQVYHVVGTDGRRSAWRWNEDKRSFVPYGRWVNAFSIDGMHELIGVPVRRMADGRPIYNMEQDRVNAINWDTDAVFEIADNPDAKGDDRWNDKVTSNYAKAKVVEHGDTIERLAKEHGVNPNLVRAIMFREQAAGPLQPAADSLGISNTLSPMGFNPDVWYGFGIDRESARDSEDNIRAAVILISRIQDRITDPTVEKIATLYNGLMMEETSGYGAQVGRYYRDKPWLEWDPSEEAEKREVSP